jgi:hypothetical protein
MEKLYSRKFDVDFYERDEKSWVVVSHLVDEAHDILTEVTVSVPDLVIREAKVTFSRAPMDVCPMIQRNVDRIVGLDLFKGYNRKSLFIFLGPKGCGNVMSLLGLGLQSFVYTYFPHLVKTGKMSVAEWERFCLTKLRRACLGHTLLEKGQAKMTHQDVIA